MSFTLEGDARSSYEWNALHVFSLFFAVDVDLLIFYRRYLPPLFEL
jgi:hypothetical protein